MTIKRYDHVIKHPAGGGAFGFMEESDDGGYVDYDDHVRAVKATGWKTMDSAPTDGTHLLLAVKYSGGFVYTVEGCYDRFRRAWSTTDGVKKPFMWMNKTPLPDGWENLV